MKKQLPAAIILGIIALIAALALAATNEVTKGPIEERAQAAIKAACEAVMTAETYEEIALEEGSAAKALYRAKSGDSVVGYVAVAETSGYGGPIETTIGMTEAGVITAINVGGMNFAETAGLGSKAKEPGFTDQFKNKKAPVSLKGIDAIGGATITTKAVVLGVNNAAETIAKDAGITLDAATEDETAESAPQTQSALQPGKNVGTAQGYQSEVKATVMVKEDGTIESVKFESVNETPGLGTQIGKDEGFAAQFAGKTPPFEIGNGIDAIGGSTTTSKAAVAAINSAQPSSEVILAQSNGGKLILTEEGQLAVTLGGEAFTGGVQLDAIMENGNITVKSFTVKAGKQSTAEVDGSTAKAKARGYASNVSATVTIDADGKISELKLNTGSETEYLGEAVMHNQKFIDQFIGQTGYLAYGNGLDVVAGSTVTSDALLVAINDCLLGLGVAQAPVAASTAEIIDEHTAKAKAKGYASNVSATVTVDDEGRIIELKLSTGSETEYLGEAVMHNQKFIDQFMGQSGALVFGDGLDVVAGSTVTSNAILNAINDCLLGLK